ARTFVHPSTLYNEFQTYPPLPRRRSLLHSNLRSICRIRSCLLTVLRLSRLRICWIWLGIPWIRLVVGIQQGGRGTGRTCWTYWAIWAHRKSIREYEM
ncbi:hypothetical protein PFISCL1PPCAC_5241, partial [Pristionchus fissidentatus]